MSTKEQLAQAIAALPDDLTMEEAVERLYLLYKIRRQLSPRELLPSRPRKTLADLIGLFATDEPPPSDEEVGRMIEEERLQKHS